MLRKNIILYMLRKNINKLIGIGSISLIGVGVYQGMQMRDNYQNSIKMLPPNGPITGEIYHLPIPVNKMIQKSKEKVTEINHKIIELKEKTNELKDKLKEKVKEKVSNVEADITKIKNEMKTLRNKIKWDNIVRKFIDTSDPEIKTGEEKDEIHIENNNDKKFKFRKIKLLLVGDSLVCGVGCEGDNTSKSPILPTILAKALSIAMRADVEWYSAGIIGAAVSDMREKLLPKIKDEFFTKLENTNINNKQNKTKIINDEYEVIVVIICGLNDWKTCIEKFPRFYGPDGFRIELGKLINEIKELAIEKKFTKSCKVFLPALPCHMGETDPNYLMSSKPILRYLFNFICSIWDNQKLSLSVDEDSTTYIGYPSNDTIYATPGIGVVSKDGIHPTSKGYKWWALHLAENICRDMD